MHVNFAFTLLFVHQTVWRVTGIISFAVSSSTLTVLVKENAPLLLSKFYESRGILRVGKISQKFCLFLEDQICLWEGLELSIRQMHR